MPYPGLNFTQEQELIRDSIAALLGEHLPSTKLQELDETYGDPTEAYQALAEAGWLGMTFKEENGGIGGSYKDIAVLIEALGYHSLSISTAYQCAAIFGGPYIEHYGSDDMKKEILPDVIAGKTRLAVAYTEPGAGSDVAAFSTRAVRDGNQYTVTGQKCFISCAQVADYLITAVKTNPEAGRKGLSLLLIDAKAEGVDIRPMKSLGRRASRINEVFFDDVKVPATRMIGEEGQAWPKLMKALNFERMVLSAGASGVCMKAIQIAKNFAEEREAFGKKITEFQGISHKFAEMQILAHTSRLHTYHIASCLDAGENPILDTAVGKTYATEAMFACSDMGLQIMGGHGYVAGDMERIFRDARLGPIGGGTSEIMRNVIAWKMMENYL